MANPLRHVHPITTSSHPTPKKAGASARVSAIDVARGTAMFFVCLAHFSGAYLWPHGMKAAELLDIVSMIASPSFVLISGMTFGFLATLHPDGVLHLRVRLFDRGIFLLVIGHLILSVSQLRRTSMAAAYSTGFLTDALAVAIILGPWLAGMTSRKTRAVLALALYCVAWTLLALWHPELPAAVAIKHYAFGGLASDTTVPHTVVFPVLLWFPIYLLGTVFGELVGSRYRVRECTQGRRLFSYVGLGLMLSGLTVYLLTREMNAVRLIVSRSPLAILLTSPTQKFPPGPAYLAFFGGSGLIFMSLVLELEARQALRWLTDSLRRVGYASLPVFLLQSFVYAAVLRPANLPYSNWWPLLFLATLVPLWTAATIWYRTESNGLLTVGLAWWLDRASQRHHGEPARALRSVIQHGPSNG
jgi:fucose 4-O-acetylase-like acetyltransferase